MRKTYAYGVGDDRKHALGVLERGGLQGVIVYGVKPFPGKEGGADSGDILSLCSRDTHISGRWSQLRETAWPDDVCNPGAQQRAESGMIWVRRTLCQFLPGNWSLMCRPFSLDSGLTWNDKSSSQCLGSCVENDSESSLGFMGKRVMGTQVHSQEWEGLQ